MQIRNSDEEFGVPGKLFHWAIALLIIGLIGLGWYMVDLDYYHPWYQDALSLHKALGMIALGLAVLKICWNWYTSPPPLQDSLSDWERTGAKSAHVFLIAMMFVIPVSGYLISTSEGVGISIFDWFEVPALFEFGESIRDLSIDVHYYTAYLTAFVVVLHAGAAIKHQLIDGHGTLRRML